MRRGRVRPLTPDEAKLWVAVARLVVPLPGGSVPAVEPDPAPLAADAPAPRPPPPRPAAVPSPVRPALKPLAPIEAKLRRGIARGRLRPDATLDLHGLQQVEAHAALNAFLFRAQAQGHGLVAIVTGKGRPGLALLDGSERGVLRRTVPHWLAAPVLRQVVLGWEEAPPNRGGAGALLVRLRGRRAG